MTDDESVRRLRSEVPPPDTDAWAKVRAAVQHEIAVELETPRGSSRIGRWRSPRLLAVGLAALGLTAAAAYGATALIGVGSPAPNPPSPLTPSNIKVLGFRVPDRAGGPPWGLRLALSQPGLAQRRPDVAIQIGRILNGKMGFIGKDNAFDDDGLFHAAGPNSALTTPANYAISGTPQNPDLATVYHFALTLPAVASAYQGCSNISVPIRTVLSRRVIASREQAMKRLLGVLRADGSAARRDAQQSGFRGNLAALRLNVAENLQFVEEQATGHETERTFATCPASDLRTIVFGFAGPPTAAITITGRGIHETEPLRPDDDGFYLFVLTQHWSYASKFRTTATCHDGHTVSGLAAPGTPDAPYCRAG